MNFKDFNKKIQEQFSRMQQTGMLFRANVSGQDLWEVYLNSFKTKLKFRDPESSEHDCNNCRNFIKRYGNIVAIMPNGEIESLFSNVTEIGEYSTSALLLDASIKNERIKDIFLEDYKMLNEKLNYESCKKNQETYKLGIASNFKKYTAEEVATFGVVNAETVYEFNHFSIDIPNKYVNFTMKSIEAIMAGYRDKANVFERAMEEIPVETLMLVKDLINQNSLLDGGAHLPAIDKMIEYKNLYNKIEVNLNAFCWATTYNLHEGIAKFRNTLIGVLCVELAEGTELNKACENWNKRVDPANYMKAVAPITNKQKEEAQKFVEENGYVESFSRRFAILDDIKVDEIKHINNGDGKIENVSIFDDVKTKSTRHKRNEFEGVEEVSIEKFMKDILPSCTSVEAYLDNGHKNNMVTMTTSEDKKAKQIFKWDNPYSWTYNGNLAGKSLIKEAVKSEGGIVDGVLNFRLAWNDGKNSNDGSDLDAWAVEPNGTRIGYSTPYRKNKRNRSQMSGQLDVDNTNPGGKLAVENITWIDKSAMQDGVYKLWVNQYSERNSQGFKAEIEFNGELYTYSYDGMVTWHVKVAEITLKNGEFSIKHLLPLSSSTSQDIYGLTTKQFHKVNLVCLSPNHWGENNVGNKHYFFMLDKCKTDKAIRSFHSENLKTEVSKHRKVLEILGAVSMLEPTAKQLTGLGYNATIKDNVILKLKGNFKRTIKVIF